MIDCRSMADGERESKQIQPELLTIGHVFPQWLLIVISRGGSRKGLGGAAGTKCYYYYSSSPLLAPNSYMYDL